MLPKLVILIAIAALLPPKGDSAGTDQLHSYRLVTFVECLSRPFDLNLILSSLMQKNFWETTYKRVMKIWPVCASHSI